MTTSNSSLPPPGLCAACNRALSLAFWAALTLLLLLDVFRPIRDPDFWWHLKTGDVMIRQNGLLQQDPFNYTGDGAVRGLQAVLLHGYWLWEITSAALYKLFGFPGIFFLKFLTASLMAGAVLFEMSRHRLSPFTRIVLAGLGTLVIINVYHFERPQLFSIVFMTLLIGMISRTRSEHPPWLLFPMMILWANIHGGFVVGDIVLGLAAAGFMIQHRHEPGRRGRLMIWAVAGILASFINPNGWNTLLELCNFMGDSIGPTFVTEYRSTWQLFLLQSKMSAVCLWTLAALHLGALVLVPRRFWPDIFISLFLVAFGIAFIRNTGFIAVSLLPMTGWYVERAYAGGTHAMPRHWRTAVCALLLVVICWVDLGEWQERRAVHGPIFNSFPVAMANFLKDSGLSGRLFNDYNDGGYLDWALYPQWKTFIDGREYDKRVSNQYLRIASAAMDDVEGRPYCELMLDRYQIDVVALGIALADGRLQPLLKRLFNKPQWVPVFLDDQSFVIVRNTWRNASAIRRYGLDKTCFLEMLTRLIGYRANCSPHDIRLSVMYADILMYVGRVRDAEHVLKELETAGLNPEMLTYLKAQYQSSKGEQFNDQAS